MVARRSGPRGRNLDTVGTYMCADLACSLYLRGLRRQGYTQEEIKTIASDAGFTVPGDLFETGKRQKQA